MQYDQNGLNGPDELQPDLQPKIQENADSVTDSNTDTAPPVVRPELQPVVQPEIQPVIPAESNGVVQKSLKLSSWLAKTLELEAAESSLPFNTHIVNILTNREKLAVDFEKMKSANEDLKRSYHSLNATNSVLAEENAELRAELRISSDKNIQLWPQMETMRKVLAGLIKDVSEASTLKTDALTAHAEALYNYYLQNPDK